MNGRQDESFTKALRQTQGPYRQKSVKKRIEALFLDNLGKVLTREQIIEAATDPDSGRQPENWHQRGNPGTQ